MRPDLASSLIALAVAHQLGCAGSGPGADPDDTIAPAGSLAVQVGALATAGDFVPIVTATYDLVIEAFDPALGWVETLREEGVDSRAPSGAMVFVAPCQTYPDGSDRPGQVTITLTDVRGPGGVALEDAELPAPQTQQFNCKLEQDALVPFHFTVLRSANRGFVDLAIDIDDVLCSAKFDCQQALLHGPDGKPAPTLVTGLSCRGTGPDTSIVFAGELVCFDDEGIPERPITTREVFNGFEDATGQAFHNTATLLDDGLVAAYDHCVYRATGLPTSRGGGPRDAKFRQGVGRVAWDLDIRHDEAGRLVCTGKVGPSWVDVRADDAATPRDGSIRPSRANPVREQVYTLTNLPRRFPDCGAQEAAAAESKAFLRESLADREQLVDDVAALEAQLAAGALVVGELEAAHQALVDADAAAAIDPNGDDVMDALVVALQKTNAVPAEAGDKARAVEAIWVLIDDADRDTHDPAHHAAARTENEALRAALGARIDAGKGALSVAQGKLEAHDAKHAETVVRHSQLVDSMTSCRDGQRERRGIAVASVASTFPWAQGAQEDPEIEVGWASVVDSAGRLQDAEILSACAYGDVDAVARIVTQVRTWSLIDDEGERGYLHFIREPPPFEGFACIGKDGGCDLFPETEIPCAFDNAEPFDREGGYFMSAWSDEP
ncbi:MAG: hypothetical protein IT385_02365 [Deltaproteobacteria bacterium]|nr:hypothetical protein [Deltaproteobacteria bacterium]